MNDNPQPTPHSEEANLPVRRYDAGQGRLPHAANHRPQSRGYSSPAPQQLSPKFFLWVLTRSWKVAIPCGLILAAGVAATLLYTYVPQYRASGLIKIEANQPFIAFRGGAVERNSRQFVRTQIEIMRSPIVLRQTLQDERVGAASHLSAIRDRVTAIRKRLGITRIGGSEIYRVSYSSPSQQESSDVVTAVIREYFSRQEQDGYGRVQRVVDLLERERARRKIEVERLQSKVVELSKEVTGKDPFGHNTLVDVKKAMSPLASLHRQLTDVEVRIEILRAELQSHEESEVVAVDRADSTKLVDWEVEMHSEVRSRKRAIEQTRTQLRERKSLFNDSHLESDQTFLALTESLERQTQELAELKPILRQQLLNASKAGRKIGRQSEADVMREEIASLELKEELLRKRFATELNNVQESGGKGAELEFAKAELAREEKVFEMIAARKLAIQTESKAPARIEIMDEVTASPTPIEAAPWKKLIMACSLAFIAPFGIAVLREITLRRVTDAEQLFEDTNLRILGEIASFPTRRVAANPRQLPAKLRKEMYAFAESIDALRMGLSFSANNEEHRVIAITSAVSGEGKSSVSIALAMSFANATKKRTLLIDGDMRDPSVHEFVDAPDSPGLSDVLAGKSKLDEAIQPAEGTEQLFVLRAGKNPTSPHHLAQPQRFNKLVAALRDNFDAIVIDTPPVLGASESLGICRAADMTAVCTRRGVSRLRQVKLATEKLEAAGAAVTGSVLSGVPTSGYGYAYAYGYGYRDEPQQIGMEG